MHFSNPEAFWLLTAPVVFLIGFIYYLKKRKRLLLLFAVKENIARLTGSVSMDKKVFRIIFLLLSLTFLVIAAAGPQWGKELEEISRRGIDVIIALDTSRSMMAQDIKPSRLDKAKKEIMNFLDRLKGDRVGLIFFAGDSMIQCPLTLDYGAVLTFLEIAGPDIIPTPGTDIGGAIEKAVEAFEISGKKSRVLVLMTDGETHTANTDDAVAKAAEKGIIIYTVGFGRGDGVPIPLRDEDGNIIGYKRDEEGNPVLSSLNQRILTDIAQATGGLFFPASTGESELEKIADAIDDMEKARFKGKKGTKYKDRYQYPLTVAVLLFIGYFIINDRKKGY